jgi:hypothetical protein
MSVTTTANPLGAWGHGGNSRDEAPLGPLVGDLGAKVRCLRRAGVETRDLGKLLDALSSELRRAQLDSRVAAASDPLPSRQITKVGGARAVRGRGHGTGSAGNPMLVPMSSARCARAAVGVHLAAASRALALTDVATARRALVSGLGCLGREWMTRD